MTDAEARLKALMRADAPVSPDPWFRIALMERMARRRLLFRLAVVGAAGVAGAVVIQPLAPALAGLADNSMLSGAGVLIAVAATVWAVRKIRRPI